MYIIHDTMGISYLLLLFFFSLSGSPGSPPECQAQVLQDLPPPRQSQGLSRDPASGHQQLVSEPCPSPGLSKQLNGALQRACGKSASASDLLERSEEGPAPPQHCRSRSSPTGDRLNQVAHATFGIKPICSEWWRILVLPGALQNTVYCIFMRIPPLISKKKKKRFKERTKYQEQIFKLEERKSSLLLTMPVKKILFFVMYFVALQFIWAHFTNNRQLALSHTGNTQHPQSFRWGAREPDSVAGRCPLWTMTKIKHTCTCIIHTSTELWKECSQGLICFLSLLFSDQSSQCHINIITVESHILSLTSNNRFYCRVVTLSLLM